MTNPARPRLITAAGVADCAGVAAAPGCLLFGPGITPTILAAGTPDQVASHPAAAVAERVERPDAVLIPALVNAHTHLDLTSVGPRAFDRGAGFPAWLQMVLRSRANDPQDIHNAVAEGVARSLAGGVVAVGDIAGTGRLEAAQALLSSPLIGVSFVEYFGNKNDWCLPETLRATARVRIGIQPHAPYSAGPALYRAALASGLPVSTHLAESLAERELLTRGTGPMRDFLQSIGAWTPENAMRFGDGGHRGDGGRGGGRGGRGGARSSVEYLGEFIESGAPIVLAHVNDADDADIELLANSSCSVVYCPRSHEYFGNDVELGPHRYREMVAAGVNVALGTDSIINVPPHEANRLSTLDEMRRLWKRDRTDPMLLLRMATINGARALGLAPSLFDLSPGETAGIVAVPVREGNGGGRTHHPLWRILETDSLPRLLTVDV